MTGVNRSIAVKLDAIDALVAVMRAQVHNAGVMEQACKALGSICSNHGALLYG